MYSHIIEQSPFLTELKKCCSYFLIGGCLRNTQFNIPIKDYDCLVENIKDEKRYNDLIGICQKNKMDGWKYTNEPKNIDIFYFKTTFLTKLNINIENPVDFLQYCFFNMYCILYDVHCHKIIKHKNYLDFEKTKKMDINFPHTFILNKQYQKMLKYQQYFSCSENTLAFFKNNLKK